MTLQNYNEWNRTKTDKDKVLERYPNAKSEKKIVSVEKKLRFPDRIVIRKQHGYEVVAGPYKWFRADTNAREGWRSIWDSIKRDDQKKEAQEKKEKMLNDFSYFESQFLFSGISMFRLTETQITNMKRQIWDEIKSHN